MEHCNFFIYTVSFFIFSSHAARVHQRVPVFFIFFLKGLPICISLSVNTIDHSGRFPWHWLWVGAPVPAPAAAAV